MPLQEPICCIILAKIELSTKLPEFVGVYGSETLDQQKNKF